MLVLFEMLSLGCIQGYQYLQPNFSYHTTSCSMSLSIYRLIPNGKGATFLSWRTRKHVQCNMQTTTAFEGFLCLFVWVFFFFFLQTLDLFKYAKCAYYLKLRQRQLYFRAHGKIIARQPRQISSILLETPNHQSTKTGHASIATKTYTASTKTRNI